MQHTGIPVINFLLFIFHFFPHIQICEKPGGVARLFRRRYFVSYGVYVLGGYIYYNSITPHKSVHKDIFFSRFFAVNFNSCFLLYFYISPSLCMTGS